MISAAAILMLSSMLYSLRLSSGSFPKPLSAKEEQEYLEKAAAGDLEARNILIERNLRLVAHIMKKYYAQTSDQEDLISIGTIGLIKAVSTFDAGKGIRLATYAARCVENEILMHFRSQRKSASDVSLSDYIETGKDGTALSLMDVVCQDDDMFDRISSREDVPTAPAVHGGGPGRPGAEGTDPALRPGRERAPAPAGGGSAMQHQPLLHIPHRKKGAGEAPKRL